MAKYKFFKITRRTGSRSHSLAVIEGNSAPELSCKIRSGVLLGKFFPQCSNYYELFPEVIMTKNKEPYPRREDVILKCLPCFPLDYKIEKHHFSYRENKQASLGHVWVLIDPTRQKLYDGFLLEDQPIIPKEDQPVLERMDDRIWAHTPCYNKGFVDGIKTIKWHVWDYDQSVWYVPDTEENYAAVLNLMKMHFGYQDVSLEEKLKSCPRFDPATMRLAGEMQWTDGSMDVRFTFCPGDCEFRIMDD